MEFCYGLTCRYNIESSGLPPKCDGCNYYEIDSNGDRISDLEAGLKKGLKNGYEKEVVLFEELMLSDVSKALRNLFFTTTSATNGSQLFHHGGAFPAMKFGNATTHDGSGSIDNSDSLTTRFAVRVVDVLPNRNMLVEGIRQFGRPDVREF